MNWQPIETARFDDKPVLIYHTTHGIMQGRYYPSEQYETINGTEVDGAVWVLGDDILQEEVERWRIPDNEGGGWHIWCESITHWAELPELPRAVEDAPKC